jgi:DNA topoisomerase-6 subunit B
MLRATESRTLQSFLTNEFSRVGPGTAKEICENAELLPAFKPKELSSPQIEKLHQGIKKTKIIAPSTDCIVPIGSDLLEKGLKKEVDAEFYAAVTRSPSVYRGNPFVIECALAYGGKQPAEEPMRILRFANRVPLLYQQSACAIFRSILHTNWRPYGLSQSSGALPQGPLTLVVHLASVWPPFTSEAKEALAHYPEIIKEIKLAVQEVGRKLSIYVHKKRRVADESAKRSYIEKYIPHLGEALKDLLDLKKTEETKVEEMLKEILEKHRGKIEEIEAENVEYDEKFAKIGKGEEKEEDGSEE